MANREHLAKLKEGVEAWNEWRRTIRRVDLREADLRRMDLLDYNLAAVDLSGCNLTDASLVLTNCSFANLTDADLTGANLLHANFNYATLDGADLSWTRLGETLFARTSLRDAKLANIHYLGSCSIGIDTLFRSGGLPEDFLRGCGVPEEFIAYANSLVGTAIDYYSCFISYSSKDEAIARRLRSDLRERKIRVYFAPEDLKIGDRLRPRIDEAIHVHEKLVLILSAHSINSAWVQREVEIALEREDREQRDLLFPIRLDDSIFASDDAWAREVARRHIGDFRADYANAFNRLVKDLEKEGPIIMK